MPSLHVLTTVVPALFPPLDDGMTSYGHLPITLEGGTLTEGKLSIQAF